MEGHRHPEAGREVQRTKNKEEKNKETNNPQ